MKNNRSALLLCLLLAFSTCRTAFAGVFLYDSLEWMSQDTPLIVSGKVTKVSDTKDSETTIYRDVTIAIEEKFKGGYRDKTIVIRLQPSPRSRAGIEWLHSGHSYLFFLWQVPPEIEKARFQWWEDDMGLYGRWFLHPRNDFVIPLNDAVTPNKPGAFQQLYTADMKPVRDVATILGTVRKWALRPVLPGNPSFKQEYIGQSNFLDHQAGYLRLELKTQPDDHIGGQQGSLCYINVPVDEKYRPLAMAKASSAEPFERRYGAAMLRNFPGPETVKLLTSLLADPAKFDRHLGEGRTTVVYLIRRNAYASLIVLGEKPEKPLFYQE